MSLEVEGKQKKAVVWKIYWPLLLIPFSTLVRGALRVLWNLFEWQDSAFDTVAYVATGSIFLVALWMAFFLYEKHNKKLPRRLKWALVFLSLMFILGLIGNILCKKRFLT